MFRVNFMELDNFFSGLAEILEIDEDVVTEQLSLADSRIDWDSLAIVSTIALVDEIFDVTLDGQSLAECEHVSDIIKLANANNT